MLLLKDANNIFVACIVARSKDTCWLCLYVTSDVKGLVYFQISLFAEECNHTFPKVQLYVHLIELILH